jgi:hypothetical protein
LILPAMSKTAELVKKPQGILGVNVFLVAGVFRLRALCCSWVHHVQQSFFLLQLTSLTCKMCN